MATNIKTALAAFLLADPTLRTLVGNRIYPRKRDPRFELFPAVTYRRMAWEGDALLSGPGSRCHSRLELRIYDEYEAGAGAVEDAIRNAVGDTAVATPETSDLSKLHGFKGLMNGIEIQSSWITDVYDDLVPADWEEDPYVVVMELEMTYVEA